MVAVASWLMSVADEGAVQGTQTKQAVAQAQAVSEGITTGIGLTNYPNPFNPSTTISFTVPQDGFVSLKVYDMLGRVASELVNEQKLAGRYQVRFDASELASGMYLYELRASGQRQVQKMVVTK